MDNKDINDKRSGTDRRVSQQPENEPIAVERRVNDRRDDQD